METLPNTTTTSTTAADGNPGDCQAVAADSTTAVIEVCNVEQQSAAAPTTTTNEELQQHVSSTTATATTTTAKHGASPPTTTNPATNSNKLKSQQQQNAPTTSIKFHQFRAPQQFVKHKKSTSMLAKKNKTWNKRQNKCHLNKLQQQQQQQQNSCTLLAGGGGIAGVIGVDGANIGALPATKADLENIQNLKNQLGGSGGGGHHPYYHHQHHAQQQHHHGGGHRLGGGAGNGGGGGGGNTGNGILPCLCNLEKLGYGHGHLKQQLYKKMLAHRGHHHHVLCAGAAHNTLCGGTSACCLANGCSVQNGKDTASVNSHNSSNGGGGGGGGINQSLHYCCIRSKFFLPDKRIRKEVIIPPTKFLLGGNISDPLNLNSLQNEASNASSNNNTPATTPRQSPITTPPKVEVIIPPNIHDPLHLLDPVDSMEYEKQLTSPMKRKTNKSKHRHRKNRKPKRRRYESYNSTIMDEDVPPLAGGGGSTSSALANSTMTTEASSSNATTTTLSLSNSVENISEEHKENHNSPVVVAPINANLLLSTAATTTATTTEYVEKNTEILSPSGGGGGGGGVGIGIQQQQQQSQHVASAATVGETSVAAVEMLHVRRTSERERASKDLRLDLNLCSGGTSVVVGISANNSNNNSASSSTCGSVGGGGGSGLGGGGRKRKISESSNSQKNKKFHRLDSMDKIVSPVVPQPGAWKRPPRLVVPTGARKASRRSTSISETDLLSPADETAKPLIIDTESNRGDTPDLNKMETTSDVGLGSPLSTISAATSVATAGEQDSMAGDTSVGEVITPTTTTTTIPVVNAAEESVANATKSTATHTTIAQLTKTPKFRADGAKYQYGNYDHYPGFRHLNEFMDVRLQVFQRHMELFQNKDVLDIGCNVGHMTITVARNLAPKSILGLDIDKDLIARARRNLSMYVRIPAEAGAKPKEVSKIEATKTELLSAAKKTRRQKKKKKQQQQQQQPALSALHTHHHHYHHMLLLHHQHHLLQQQQHVTNKLHVEASELFPVSFPINYGPVPGVSDAAATPLTTSSTPGHPSAAASTSAAAAAAAGANTSAISSSSSKSKNDFPKNVFFRQTNYVLKDESQMNHDSQQYDLIMCLSVTKWIHLNFGDNGLKMAFKRMFNQLRPGGKLILEAQNWASYKKKKNLTETIYNNYRNIEFYPNKFHEYLLSPEVGFSHTYTLGVPRHLNKGFCRPIQLYAKGDYTPNHVRWSDAYYPQTPYEAYRGIYATMAPRSAGSASMVYPLLSSSRSQNYDTPHHPGGVGGAGGGGRSGSYSLRQTPMHQPTSQYYNPLETDSYLPSYDMEYLNHLYVFASPLYQTVWSPPASLRNSSSHTPLFGSVRDAELDGDGGSGSAGGGSYHRHVYPPNDDTSSPNASAGGAFNSIRDPDTDDSNQLPASSVHVYATNCESSSSPQVQHLQDSETIDEVGLLLSEASGDEQQHVGGSGSVSGGANNCCGDSNEA